MTQPCHWPTTVDRAAVSQTVVLPSGERRVVHDPPTTPLVVDPDEPGEPAATTGPTVACALGVVVGLLGRGVASCDRMDPQAKGLGEYLRAKIVDVPEMLS